MSSNRKMLKILSLVQIVFAVLCFVMASLVFNGTPRVEGDADVLTLMASRAPTVPAPWERILLWPCWQS